MLFYEGDVTVDLAGRVPMTADDRRGAFVAPPSYLTGLIGEGIGASLTPSLHEKEAARLGLRYEYRLLDLLQLGVSPDALADVLDEVSARGFHAVNITHPCKQRAFDLVDVVDDDARRLGAVNLIVLRDGRRVGYNTDWKGFRDGLEAGLPNASFARVVQIGCGGAGAATAYALLSGGAGALTLADVDEERAIGLADGLRAMFPGADIRAVRAGDVGAALQAATGVVHATPVGMAHHPGVAFDVGILRRGTWVSDVVYRPLATELIRAAARRGLPVLDGGRMAVGQAFASLEIITGIRPDRRRMERHFRELVSAERAREGGAE